ncbi:sensor histidine kinase [Archangium violaceum]|uniref:sensor histidine kinase n=1 Tax=Archangium violaceum TaxID=83451 RepID=UPI001EF5F0D2|nr:HAMP domain-containing sensor histidine kinase [Archangium violaceum]
MPSTAALPSPPAPGSEARLAFAELLLGCDDARTCAEAAVAWLVHNAGVQQVLCLAPDESDSHCLVPLAWHGLSSAESFVLALHDAKHPLVEALQWTEPHWFHPGQLPMELPMARTGLFTLSLGKASPGTPSPGLLLVASPVPELSPDVPWLAGHLGMHLTRLYKGRQLSRLEAASTELAARVNAATEELATQNELLRRQAIQLEQASAAKSQFLANMSHELRTPLNAILGYTNMLLQGVNGELPPPQRRSLSRIDSNGRHLLEIINEILDITRIEAGRMPLHLSEFRLPELVQEVMAELDPIIVRSKLAVSASLEPNLPPVHSDRQKVKQIVVNLLSNALKFTHEGSIKVLASYEFATATFHIAVEDTGIGIDPCHQEKIWEDFQQVDSSPTRAYGGTGLGLSICRRLATMLDGRISLRSAPAQGSTFTLYLPRRTRRT